MHGTSDDESSVIQRNQIITFGPSHDSLGSSEVDVDINTRIYSRLFINEESNEEEEGENHMGNSNNRSMINEDKERRGEQFLT